MTIYWLKKLISGELLYVKCDEVKVCFAPMYESMTLRIILNEGFKHEGVRRYFPEDRDLHRLPRDWCLNTIYSIVGKPWKDWVDNQRN